VKNQYFGDVNDYRKYGLLRILMDNGKLNSGICWMLTPDDRRSDGKFTQYLEQPLRWRKYDPGLFDYLEGCLKVDQIRDVNKLSNTSILPSTKYYADIFYDGIENQNKYFNEMLSRFKDMDLIFFDPDNGMEIKSKKRGQKGSCKFLYWDQLIQAYRGDHSILIYQHFIRENREAFIKRIAGEMNNKTGSKIIYSFSTSNVVFFLILQTKHVNYFEQQIKTIPTVWESQIVPSLHNYR
jgi:hypothetical protein